MPEESDEQVQERMRKMCEEQQQAEERRKRESAIRKENAEREREKGFATFLSPFMTYLKPYFRTHRGRRTPQSQG